jgi:hypothetical protein
MAISRYIKAMSLIGKGDAVVEQIAMSVASMAETHAIRAKTGAAANPIQLARSAVNVPASLLVAEIGIPGPFSVSDGFGAESLPQSDDSVRVRTLTQLLMQLR